MESRDCIERKIETQACQHVYVNVCVCVCLNLVSVPSYICWSSCLQSFVYIITHQNLQTRVHRVEQARTRGWISSIFTCPSTQVMSRFTQQMHQLIVLQLATMWNLPVLVPTCHWWVLQCLQTKSVLQYYCMLQALWLLVQMAV